MPRSTPQPWATFLRLTALLVVGWSAACALVGPGLEASARGELGQSSSGDRLHWRPVAAGLVAHAEPIADPDDVDERWKGCKLACLSATGHPLDAWGLPPSELCQITSPLSPRGTFPLCLRC